MRCRILDMTTGWKCPDCGKEYEAAPKWCPCEPYPMPESYLAFYVVEMDPGKKTDWGNEESLGQMPGLEDFLEEPGPFKKVTIIEKLVGAMEVLGSEPVGCGTGSEEDMLETAERLLYSKLDEARDTTDGTGTGFMIVQEYFHPGVEVLDTLTWKVVDITREEYGRLLEKVL